MTCQVSISDFLIIRNADKPDQQLSLDISRFYCRLFETTRDQCRDYLDEIMHWAGGVIDNYDYLSDSLFHHTFVRRRLYGFNR